MVRLQSTTAVVLIGLTLVFVFTSTAVLPVYSVAALAIRNLQ